MVSSGKPSFIRSKFGSSLAESVKRKISARALYFQLNMIILCIYVWFLYAYLLQSATSRFAIPNNQQTLKSVHQSVAHVNLNYTVRIGVHYYFDLLISSTDNNNKKREQRNSNNNNNMTTTDYPPFHESNFSLREKIKLYIYTLILYYVFFSWKCETKSRTELFWLWADTTCHVTTRQECSNWEWRICSLQYICLPSVEVLMYVEHAIIRNLSALITI